MSSTLQTFRAIETSPATRVERSCTLSDLQGILNGVSTGLLSFDQTLGILIANDRLAAILDIPPPVLRHCTAVLDLLEASSALTRDTIQKIHEACLVIASTTEVPSSHTFTSVCGKRVFTLQLSRIDNGHCMACFEEITARRLAEAQTLHSAMHDSLTGLCSRPLFHERASAMLAGQHGGATSHALMMIDRNCPGSLAWLS